MSDDISPGQIMIDEIFVENFKGIKKLELKNLKRFNVIIGKNDVGKS